MGPVADSHPAAIWFGRRPPRRVRIAVRGGSNDQIGQFPSVRRNHRRYSGPAGNPRNPAHPRPEHRSGNRGSEENRERGGIMVPYRRRPNRIDHLHGMGGFEASEALAAAHCKCCELPSTDCRRSRGVGETIRNSVGRFRWHGECPGISYSRIHDPDRTVGTDRSHPWGVWHRWNRGGVRRPVPGSRSHQWHLHSLGEPVPAR